MARHITLIADHDKVLNHPKMTVRFNTQVKRFLGEKHLEGIEVESGGKSETLRPAGVSVFIGLKPNTAFLEGTVNLTKEGFIDAPSLATSMPGVFASGDARVLSTKQVASAVGEVRHAEMELMEPVTVPG